MNSGRLQVLAKATSGHFRKEFSWATVHCMMPASNSTR